jgi:hypothetical protein
MGKWAERNSAMWEEGLLILVSKAPVWPISAVVAAMGFAIAPLAKIASIARRIAP